MRRPLPLPARHPGPTRAHPAGRAVAALLAVVAGLLGLAVIGAPAAHAHADLTRSDPADGATLDRAPERITLEFSEDLLPETVRIVAMVTGGDPLPVPEPTVEDNVARMAWPVDAPGGAYTVSYRVVSQDGHPITGSISFSYAGSGAAASSAPPTAGSASPSGSAAPSPDGSAASGTGAPAADPSTSPAASGGSGDTSGSVVPLIAAVAVLLAVGIGAWILVRARRAAR